MSGLLAPRSLEIVAALGAEAQRQPGERSWQPSAGSAPAYLRPRRLIWLFTWRKSALGAALPQSPYWVQAAGWIGSGVGLAEKADPDVGPDAGGSACSLRAVEMLPARELLLLRCIWGGSPPWVVKEPLQVSEFVILEPETREKTGGWAG